MLLVANANGMTVATKTVETHAEMVQATKEIMWRIPECEAVTVSGEFGLFTIHREEMCLCDTAAYPCECGTAGEGC